MARAYPDPAASDDARTSPPGEWQALRGELVALLDQVEGRYARTEPEEPAITGLTQRVRSLRAQVVGPEPTTRRREALKTVKRAVDRFSDRSEEHDALTDAIAEIRGRQMSAPAAALGRRANDMPEFRELSALVGGLNGRLERLEADLKEQDGGRNEVEDVAVQVEQLTHVVELLAGAVGETGQVKRLESQIAALATLVEQGAKGDVSAINRRLDDVSATVGKLAELQAKQMEREIAREDREVADAPADVGETLAPVMDAIERSVRDVYDRIDAIEKNVAMSSGDFERLTAEMAAFTRAVKDRDAAPSKLMARVDALAARIGDFETSNGDVAGLKQDISALRDAVMAGMEPRFQRIETQISELSGRMPQPTDTSEIENQLRALMQRMDETGSQLDNLAKLYSTQPEQAGLEAMATLVAERTSDAMTRKAPAPVAMFGPDSLKSIESQITGLLKSASKAPDYEKLANMVAAKTSEAVANAAAVPARELSPQSMDTLEQRMSALLNTAGKDTAERLQKLEALLESRQEKLPLRPSAPVTSEPLPASPPGDFTPAAAAAHKNAPAKEEQLDAFLFALSAASAPAKADTMPANPAEDAPLVDPGFKDVKAKAAPMRAPTNPMASAPAPLPASDKPRFDPAAVERPPRPQSSLVEAESNPFSVRPAEMAVQPAVQEPSTSGTSTFVAAARRAQLARQDAAAAPAKGSSIIERTLGRFKPAGSAGEPEAKAAKPPKADKLPKPTKPVKDAKKARNEPSLGAPASAPQPESLAEPMEQKQSFLVRHRRPLLLAATLVAVSMLALNLVIQRMGPPRSQAQQAPAVTAPAETPADVNPAPSGDVSLVKPEPRVIDMIDGTPTASINPDTAAGFTRSATATPMPPALLASAAGAKAELPVIEAPQQTAPDVTGSIPEANVGAAPEEPFELAPEAVGPLELRQAAANGEAKAQFEIGAIYTEGRAVPQDYVEAAKWYERAAAAGFAPAQYRLGNLYEMGQGVDKDLLIAKLWYQRAADAGNRMAMHNLAALYASGSMGEQDFTNAAEWFKQAAELGMTDSQFNLGMLYARGLGVEQDFEQSYKWFSLAALSGDPDAGAARDDIAKSLDADAVNRLKEEVAGWKAAAVDLAPNFAPIGTWMEGFDPGETITSKEVVSKVQAALAKLGFDVGTADGVAGPQTAEAIKAFERGTGMSESGAINPRLLAVLGSQPV